MSDKDKPLDWSKPVAQDEKGQPIVTKAEEVEAKKAEEAHKAEAAKATGKA